MSYRGFGLLAQSPALHGLGQADVRDTSSLAPSECQEFTNYTAPPNDLKAGQVLVQVFPFVRSSAERMPAVLAQILGPDGQGGPALRKRAEQGLALAFAGGGWIADAQSQPSTTRGYLWLALAPSAPRTAGALRQDMKTMLADALRAEALPVFAPGTPSSTASASTIDLNATWGALAKGEADGQLLDAVYRAMGGAAQFGSFVRFIPSASRAAQAGGSLSSAFRTQADQMQGAVTVVRGVAALESNVAAQIDTALGMPKEQQTEAAALLNQAKAAVDQALVLVQGATRAAPSFMQLVPTQREQILSDVRTAIVNSANADIQRGTPFEPAREYLRCALLNAAKSLADRHLAATDAAITEGATAGQWLINHAPDVEDATQRLQKLQADIGKAFEQLPLGFWLKSHWGLPTWGWGLIGTGVFVVGAFGVRALVKRKKKGGPK